MKYNNSKGKNTAARVEMGCDMSFLNKGKFAKNGDDTGVPEHFEKRVLLLGLDNAGKTSVLFQMRDKSFKETTSTVGLNIENINYKRYNFTFWDVGGQATKLWKHYFDKIDGVIFVIDSTDDAKMERAREELQRLVVDETLGQVPFLLLYNKKDLVEKSRSSEDIDLIMDIAKTKE